MRQERNYKSIGYYLLAIWIVFLFIFAGGYAQRGETQPLTVKTYFRMPRDFRSRLKKHGLDKQFSVVEINDGKLYFYRDGKKCIF